MATKRDKPARPKKKPGRKRIRNDKALDLANKVWLLRVECKTIPQIAKELGVSIATVHKHMVDYRERLDDKNLDLAGIERDRSLAQLDTAMARCLQVLKKANANQAANITNAIRGVVERKAKMFGLDGPISIITNENPQLTKEAARQILQEKLGTRVLPKQLHDLQAELRSSQDPDSDSGEPTG
jgi:transcriptional antiterminator